MLDEEVQAAFHFIPKPFSVVEVMFLCRTPEVFHNNHGTVESS